MSHSMIPALTTAQMRDVDRAMIEDFGIALLQMMELAGGHLATLVRDKSGGNVEKKRIVILTGRGHNGGGGMVAARRLANWGADVSVILTAQPEEYRDVPRHQLSILQRMGMIITQSTRLPGADLILDGLIGYGLRGAPQGITADLIDHANASGTRIIALDTPSGLDTTTGTVYEPCIRADATLTLALPKVGLLAKEARKVVGDLYVADIGVPPAVYAAMRIQVPNLFAETEIVRLDE